MLLNEHSYAGQEVYPFISVSYSCKLLSLASGMGGQSFYNDCWITNINAMQIQHIGMTISASI